MAEQARKRQQRSLTTSEHLLQAARQVFETKGYQAATVGAITKAADTAHGTFYLYFRNKQEAFSRVMEQASQHLYEETSVPWTGDPHEVLRGSIAGFLDAFAGHRALWRALLEGALQDPAIERMWAGLRQPFIDRIEADLRRLREVGVIRPVDALVVANTLGSMVEWSAFQYYVLGNPSEPSVTAARMLDGLVDTWSAAVFGDPTGAPLVSGRA